MSSQTFKVGDRVQVVFRDAHEKLDFEDYLNNDISTALSAFIGPILNSQVLYVNQTKHPYLDHLCERYRKTHLPGLVGVSLSAEHARHCLDYPYIFYAPAEMLRHAVHTTITRRLTVRPE